MPIPEQHDHETIDLIVVGAGCAGLSLANELCKYEKLGKLMPRTLLIEPRAEYPADRSWCYWEQTTALGRIEADNSWSFWEFGDSEHAFVHTLDSRWQYRYLNSDRFYSERLATIHNSKQVSLHLGESVCDVTRLGDEFLVKTDRAEYHARKIVDTRPPNRNALEKSLMLQVFYGIEIEVPTSHSTDVLLAKVMCDMRTDELGFKFNYVLPLSSRRILVEITRFVDHPLEPDKLRNETFELARSLVDGDQLRVIREERGVIPMGLPTPSTIDSKVRVSVGLGGGAARPATGYAFQRLQRWASDCARQLVEVGELSPMQQDSTVVSWMDRIFLLTLQNSPQLGPTLFMALAQRVSPARLVRFLTDQPTTVDLLAIMAALPIAPLLKTALRDTRDKMTSSNGGSKCSTT